MKWHAFHTQWVLVLCVSVGAMWGGLFPARIFAEPCHDRMPFAANDPADEMPCAALLTAVIKQIEVDLTTQHLIAWENGHVVAEFAVTTGEDGAATAPGEFEILDKEEAVYSYVWRMHMPYWMGIYMVEDLENGFHALPTNDEGEELWAEALGQYPASHGCIVLSPAAAEWLFHWTEVGTKVVIHY